MVNYEKLIAAGLSATLAIGAVACSGGEGSDNSSEPTVTPPPELNIGTAIPESNGQFEYSIEEQQTDSDVLMNSDIYHSVRCDSSEERGGTFEVEDNKRILIELEGETWAVGYSIERQGDEITVFPVLNSNPEMFEYGDSVPEGMSEPLEEETFNVAEVRDNAKTYIMAIPNPDFVENGVGEPTYMTVMRFFQGSNQRGVVVEAMCLTLREMEIIDNGLAVQPTTELFPLLRFFESRQTDTQTA